ncbi:hypothetical protein ACFW04_004236 [Cataglyphis niger]
MFSRFCNLCHKTANVQFMQFQRCYKRGIKRKGNASRIERPKEIDTEGKTPIIVCKRKEFNFYEGQTYSKFESIPLASKGWQHYKSKGDFFFVYPLTNVEEEAFDNESHNEEKICDTFAQFGLNPQIINILEKYNITKPLKIQTIGIPQIMNGVNTIIAAETGCGKTLTYLLPMIDKVLRWKQLAENHYNSPMGLIITPTRELAFQIGLEAKKICQHLGIYVQTITGGKTNKMLLDPLVEKVDIIIASFGVISKLTTHKIYKLNMVRSIVLDEADALFHETFEEKLQVFLKRVPLGFIQNVNEGSSKLPIGAQFAVVSATMPSRMSKVLKNIIDVESLVNITSDKLHHILVPQKFMRIGPDDKPMELLKYIKPKIANREQVIIFNNTNSTCNWINMFLNKSKIETVCLNGDMPLYERQNKYASFKGGRCCVLCTTNAGSRGMDTVAIRHVLNYDFPNATADYIHRCGRTGRVGGVKDCRVTNFVSTPSEISVVQKIERAVRKMKPIPIFDIHETKEDGILDLLESKNIKENQQQEFSIPY